MDQVVVAHARSDVQVTDVSEALPFECPRQASNDEVTTNDLEPVWLDADGVTDDSDGRPGESDRAAIQKRSTVHDTPSDEWRLPAYLSARLATSMGGSCITAVDSSDPNQR